MSVDTPSDVYELGELANSDEIIAFGLRLRNV